MNNLFHAASIVCNFVLHTVPKPLATLHREVTEYPGSLLIYRCGRFCWWPALKHPTWNSPASWNPGWKRARNSHFRKQQGWIFRNSVLCWQYGWEQHLRSTHICPPGNWIWAMARHGTQRLVVGVNTHISSGNVEVIDCFPSARGYNTENRDLGWLFCSQEAPDLSCYSAIYKFFLQFTRASILNISSEKIFTGVPVFLRYLRTLFHLCSLLTFMGFANKRFGVLE